MAQMDRFQIAFLSSIYSVFPIHGYVIFVATFQKFTLIHSA